MGQIEQLHFGGGTPTYLSDKQMGDLMAHLHASFDFAPMQRANIRSKSIRARSAWSACTAARAGLQPHQPGRAGFRSGRAEGRQPHPARSETRAVMDAARDAGFRSISIDLIYGLPKQTMTSMEQTLDKVIAANPDRIALYNYAHLPHLFKPQRRIRSRHADARVKLDLLALCIRACARRLRLHRHGPLRQAGRRTGRGPAQGRLQRNFQGYSTRAEAELISCGVSAISAVGATYSQNEKTLEGYYEKLDEGVLPVARGIKLDNDDLLRRIVIQKLMCNFELSIVDRAGLPDPLPQYFATELEKLKAFEHDGLLTIDDDWITVTPKGRLLIRNICMVFDRYLGTPQRSCATRRRSEDDMNAAQLLPVFVVGLAGSVHCAGMCGGIVGALSAGRRAGPPVTPSRVRAAAARCARAYSRTTPAASAAIWWPARWPAAWRAARAAWRTGRRATRLLLAGQRHAGRPRPVPDERLARPGRAGTRRPRAVAPHRPAQNADAGRHPANAFALGAVGLAACGMVYSVLLTALLSGSAADGAAVMLAFGLGTLPMLTGLGLLGARLQQAMQRRPVRIACGLLVLGFGVLGLARAAGGVTPTGWICYASHHTHKPMQRRLLPLRTAFAQRRRVDRADRRAEHTMCCPAARRWRKPSSISDRKTTTATAPPTPPAPKARSNCRRNCNCTTMPIRASRSMTTAANPPSPSRASAAPPACG
jgi:oxygen-independent coproporphyrinogen-3 oxidase